MKERYILKQNWKKAHHSSFDYLWEVKSEQVEVRSKRGRNGKEIFLD